jgi:hypothetical protein
MTVKNRLADDRADAVSRFDAIADLQPHVERLEGSTCKPSPVMSMFQRSVSDLGSSSAAGGAALGSPASTMLTIRDDDGTRRRRRAIWH